MPQSDRPMLREAVARFDDPERLEAAVSALQGNGFNRADISFMAHAGLFGEHVAGGYADMRMAADDPRARHETPAESTDVRQGRTLATSLAAVIAAFGAAAVAAGVGAAAGLSAGAIGAAIGRRAGDSERQFFDEQIDRGGVLVWVRTRDAEAEERALQILRAHGAADPHLHEVPATA